nr:histone-lysine N-methyltransferase SMYD3-like isoform X7 [Dermacentor andersoni]
MLADTTDCNKLKSAVFRLFCRDCPASCRNVHVRSRGRDFVLNTFRLRLGKRRPWPCVRLLLFGIRDPKTVFCVQIRLLLRQAMSEQRCMVKGRDGVWKEKVFYRSHVTAGSGLCCRLCCHLLMHINSYLLWKLTVALSPSGIMIINSYCICNDEHSPIGTGLYIGPSILDHSCSPNAHAVYEGHKLQLRAAGDIKCSSLDGIRVSYIDVMAPKYVRQQELKSQYYFECSCTKCSNKVPDYVTEKSAALTASVTEKMKEVEEQAMQHTTTLLQLRQWAENLLETEQLVEADYARIHALDLLSKCCLGLEDYQAALPPYLAREPIYRQCYGLYSPVYGVLLYSIAKLYHVTVQLKKAMEYFEKAEAVLAVSHGHSHSLYKHLEEAYLHCKLEVENPGNGEAITVK